MKYYLDPLSIEPEEGSLFAELVRRNVIQDALPSYLRLSEMSWNTKESLITSSRNFAEFVTPVALGSDLQALLTSQSVPSTVKDVVLENALAYAEASDTAGLKQLGMYAAERGVSLEYELVDRLAKEGLDASATLALLELILSDLNEPQVSSILRTLGGDYAALTEVGKDRPKLPNTPAAVALLDFLTAHGAVNTVTEEKEYLRVNKRHK